MDFNDCLHMLYKKTEETVYDAYSREYYSSPNKLLMILYLFDERDKAASLINEFKIHNSESMYDDCIDLFSYDLDHNLTLSEKLDMLSLCGRYFKVYSNIDHIIDEIIKNDDVLELYIKTNSIKETCKFLLLNSKFDNLKQFEDILYIFLENNNELNIDWLVGQGFEDNKKNMSKFIIHYIQHNDYEYCITPLNLLCKSIYGSYIMLIKYLIDKIQVKESDKELIYSHLNDIHGKREIIYDILKEKLG